MSLFDSIISVAAEKFGLGDKAGTLLSGLMSMMTDSNTGGFGGFLSRFSDAGLGDVVNSWISSGANTELSNEQVESAIGSDAINDLASKAGVDSATATSALGFMVPQVVDKLTPDGVVPDDKDLLSKIGDFLSGWGGAALGAAAGVAGMAGSMASGAADKAGDAAGAAVDAGKKMVGGIGDAVGGVSSMATGAVGDVAGGGGGLLKWLLPLILLGLALLLGLWFCGKSPAPTAPTTNANANANKGNANTGNANANANTKMSSDDAQKKLEEMAKSGNASAEEVVKTLNFTNIKFATGSAVISPESQKLVEDAAAALKTVKEGSVIEVSGHTDNKGNPAGNMKLSDARANSVKAALVKLGVSEKMLTAKGYGDTKPKASNDTEEGRTQNRRIEYSISGSAPAATTAAPAAANTNAAKPAESNTGAKPAEANAAKPAEANAAKPATANTNAAANK